MPKRTKEHRREACETQNKEKWNKNKFKVTSDLD